MQRILTVLLICSASTGGSSYQTEESIKTNDIQKALENVNEMEKDLFHFYQQWDTLSRRLASQGTGSALDSCTKDHKKECTPEKRHELSHCIMFESQRIHDQVVEIYDKKIRQPWRKEFGDLKLILGSPHNHTVDQVKRTIWTVHLNTYSENSVRYRFYNELVSFQVPFATPNIYPIDQVYKLCLNRLFPKESLSIS